MKFQGSKTEQNLMKAFAGESQARNRYTYFAGQALKEGYMQIMAIFEETANQEKEHAKLMFKYLQGGEVEIQASFPGGVIGKTEDNHKAAAGGEHYEWTDMYPSFARTSREESFEEIARTFEMVAVMENNHEDWYLGLLNNVRNGTVFKKDRPVVWQCRNCGFIHEGEETPDSCPACHHPQSYFELLKENW